MWYLFTAMWFAANTPFLDNGIHADQHEQSHLDLEPPTKWPGGRWLFSKLVCFNAPYFGSISPFVEALEPGLCIATLRKRRAVTNHIGTVHAKVEYLRKAATDLRATAKFQNPPAFGPVAADCPVVVDVTDRAGDVVVRAIISMWISPRKPA